MARTVSKKSEAVHHILEYEQFPCYLLEGGIALYIDWVRAKAGEKYELLSLEVGENGLDTSVDGKFLINMMQVCFDGIDRHTQLFGDFFVASASCCAN